MNKHGAFCLVFNIVQSLKRERIKGSRETHLEVRTFEILVQNAATVELM